MRRQTKLFFSLTRTIYSTGFPCGPDVVVNCSAESDRKSRPGQVGSVGTAAADTLFSFKRLPRPATLHLSYITAHRLFLLAHNCSKSENLDKRQQAHRAKSSVTPSGGFQVCVTNLISALNQTTFTKIICTRLYMYSRHGQRSRYGPPPKLDTFRIVRRPDTNHHCTNG